MNSLLISLLFLFGCASQNTTEDGPETALEAVHGFYQSYFPTIHRSGTRPSMPTSQRWRELVTENARVCRLKAGSDVCGVGAGGDMYLGAQDYSTDLTLLKAGFQARELTPERIQVNFKLFPQYRDVELQQARNLIFVMVKEDGKWLMDDVIHERKSMREKIQQETNYFKSR
jgi:hypothetical protein